MTENLMAGKTCVVTGATSGIGYETALGLARMGARVLGIGRSEERCERAQAALRAMSGNGEVTYLVADLSSQAAIREVGARIRGEHRALDVVVNNAGLYTARRKLSPDGIEMQLAVNYLAAFHLTHELWPLLRKPKDARVVNLSSGSHFGARPHWLDLGLGGPYFGLKAYGLTKLACIMFTYELARRLGPGSSVSTFAVDPGLVRTGMGLKDAGPLVRLVWSLRANRGRTPEHGAQCSLFAATDPAAPLDTGRYWKDCTPIPSSRVSHDPELARRLWILSERLSGIAPGTYGCPGAEPRAPLIQP